MKDNFEERTQYSILVVDDTAANLNVLTDMLTESGYKVRPVPSGKLAISVAKRTSPDLILLDITMPGLNGYEVCEILKNDEDLKEIPIIFISALSDTSDKVKAFNVGGVDYINKPFQVEEVQARVKTHLELYSLKRKLVKQNLSLENQVQLKIEEISNSQMAIIFAMAKLSQSRDDDTGKHIDRVQIFCKILAEKLSENVKYKDIISNEYIENIYEASPLHDIGKVGIADSILLKPGKLTEEEFEIMKKHSAIGAHTLLEVRSKYPEISFISMGMAISRYHHEKWDGSGYPDGLAGEDIPLCARIMAIADVYDALKSKRCYKNEKSHEESCQIIIDGRGKHFDPTVVDAFCQVRDLYLTNWQRLQD